MKKSIVLIAAFVSFTYFVNAQSSCIPNHIHLTAVARDTSSMHNPVTTPVDVKVQFTADSGGAVIYCENITFIQPNQFGEFSVDIGDNNFLCNPFDSLGAVLWQTCNLWYNISYRPYQSSLTYYPVATDHFSSAPYAFASRTAEKLITPGLTTGNVLTWNGSIWTSQAPNVYTAGTGINIAGNVISNTAPDKTVAMTSGTGVSVTGTYPNFTVTNTAPDQTVVMNSGTGVSVTGTYPNFTVTNTSPDQTVTITAGPGVSVSGTYPNFTVTNTAVTPLGSIMAYGGTTAPAGWLLCDGSLYGNTTYPALYAVIGTSYGGSTNVFNVPDFRGRFLRGVDSSAIGVANNDPDHYSRTAMNAGGNTGNRIGSVQADTLKSHSHGTDVIQNTYWNQCCNATLEAGPGTGTTSPFGGNETRPKNANVNYIIKW